MAYRQIFENLSKGVRSSETWLISTMPRGGLQIVQPAHVGDTWLKLYTRTFHLDDAASWRAILDNRPVRGAAVFPRGLESSRYYTGFLQQGKLRHVAAAPVTDPLLVGYPAALHLYRTAEQGDFSDADLRAISEGAAQISRSAAEDRAARLSEQCANPPQWARRTSTRMLILDSNLRSLLGHGTGDLDERVAEQIRQDARQRFQHLVGDDSHTYRLAFPDSNGELWIFRAAPYRRYPALSEGPVIIYCMEPDYCDLLSVRAGDVAADAELSRLVPAIHFLQQNYQRGPTLNEIARTVHLSPFHFHRRFTELLGITPKHVLLNTQIFHAKRLLHGRNAKLTEIARTCGFAHQSHFTSRFKQATGLTPTRWRKLPPRIHRQTSGTASSAH